MSFAGVIHEDAPHQLRCHREEMDPVFPVHVLPASQAQVSFVDQGGALQGMSWTLACQKVPGQPAEFVVYHRDQRVSSRSIAFTPTAEQFRYLVAGRIGTHRYPQGR